MSTKPWYIFGAGAVGTTLQHLLACNKLGSTLLHHRQHPEVRILNQQGVATSYEALPIGSLPPESIDRLTITTKAGNVADALLQATPHLAENAIVLVLANGLGWEAQCRTPNVSFARAISTAAAFRTSSHEIELVSVGETAVGTMFNATVPPDWFNEGLGTLPGWHWETAIDRAANRKFCLNCVINPLTVHYRCRNGELLTNSIASEHLRSLCLESETAMRALGLWPKGEELLVAAEAVCQSTADNQSSMLQDVLNQRPTELEFLSGEFLRRAQSHDVDLPQMARLVESIRLHSQLGDELCE